MLSRRALLKGGISLILASSAAHVRAAATGDARAAKGFQVPYSAGRDLPSINVPADACDCHHHIYDPVRFPYVPSDVRNQPPATVDAYRLLQKRLGTTRSVIVQPSAYGTDNACTLDALRQLGANARAVVVVDRAISEKRLEAMHREGVRGVRFNISTGASKDRDGIRDVAAKVANFGWHLHFWMSANDTVEMESFLHQLPNQIVFDHRGHIPQPEGVSHPAFRVICGLVEKNRAWVKLSGLYQDSAAGEPGYADTVKVGRAFVRFAPERMVWGSDWPHPSIFSERKPWPDDVNMLNLLADQAPDESTRTRILVDNPARLYGF